MLVEVNLLPKKEPKNYTLMAVLLAALLLFLVAGIFLFWQGTRFENKLATLDNQIATSKKITEAEQLKVMDNQVSSSVSVLETAVNWANEAPVKAVPVIKHVTALLPNRGFIQTISYTETGTVSLTVQFDTSRDAAYYLKNLLDSEWITEVTLSSVSTSEEDKEETTGTSTATETQIVKDNQIVPRYIGQYELKLDREFINDQEKAESTNDSQQGGKQS